jgi:hypothetical protein
MRLGCCIWLWICSAFLTISDDFEALDRASSRLLTTQGFLEPQQLTRTSQKHLPSTEIRVKTTLFPYNLSELRSANLEPQFCLFGTMRKVSA